MLKRKKKLLKECVECCVEGARRKRQGEDGGASISMRISDSGFGGMGV
jgi:hypothetical protein